MRAGSEQQGNIALVMVVVLMTIGLVLIKSLHYYQERARDEFRQESRYLKAFNQAESALSWGKTQTWKMNMGKNVPWECKQIPSESWKSCLKHYKGNIFILLGQSHFNQHETISVYQWVSVIAGTPKIKARKKGWLDYCPVEAKGFCQ